MKKINIFGKERATLEIASIFVFVLILVANLVAIRFAEGYFGYFNIPLAEVNYVPQMYDYVRIALPIIISAIVAMVVVLSFMGLSIYVGSLLAKLTKSNKKAIKYVQRHKEFFEILTSFIDLLIKIGVWFVIVWCLWGAIYNFSVDFGRASAESMTKVSSVSSADDKLQKVIIYKGVNELIIKTYDTSRSKFLDGYNVLYGTSYTTRTIDR